MSWGQYLAPGFGEQPGAGAAEEGEIVGHAGGESEAGEVSTGLSFEVAFVEEVRRDESEGESQQETSIAVMSWMK